jgi:putative transposase
VPLADRQPLERPTAANQVWSIDFEFDRVAGGRRLKILGIVDDATHEAVALHVEHAMGGDHLVRVMDRICSTRGYPEVIRSDNAQEFIGRAMNEWAHDHDVTLRQIEPGKPNQNAYIESFNGRFRDECLNEHWFVHIAHARAVIGAWKREYNAERPKRTLGGLTPEQYAGQLAQKSDTVTDSTLDGSATQ